MTHLTSEYLQTEFQAWLNTSIKKEIPDGARELLMKNFVSGALRFEKIFLENIKDGDSYKNNYIIKKIKSCFKVFIKQELYPLEFSKIKGRHILEEEFQKHLEDNFPNIHSDDVAPFRLAFYSGALVALKRYD